MIEYLLFAGFFLLARSHGKMCPCPNNKTMQCIRYEFYGVQFNHFLLFMLLGFLFPRKFWTFMMFGLLWEIWEHRITQDPEWVKKFGGCLAPRDTNTQDPPWHHRVWGGERKYHNPIDEGLGLEMPQWHTWHGSPAELVPNALGFLLGMFFSRFLLNVSRDSATR